LQKGTYSQSKKTNDSASIAFDAAAPISVSRHLHGSVPGNSHYAPFVVLQKEKQPSKWTSTGSIKHGNVC